jgi:hypothetical protein
VYENAALYYARVSHSVGGPEEDEAETARRDADFERHVKMLLLPLYRAQQKAAQAPAGDSVRVLLLSLYLLLLLVSARLADFHGLVETLAAADLRQPALAWVTRLESYMAEGSYNRVLQESANAAPVAALSPVAALAVAPLLRRLETATRADIAECAAASTTSLSLAAAAKLFMLGPDANGNGGQKALMEFIARRPDWRVEGNTLYFNAEGAKGTPAAASAASIQPVDAVTLVANTLSYAVEVERII